MALSGTLIAALVALGLILSTQRGLDRQINTAIEADLSGFRDLYDQRRLIGLREGMERRIAAGEQDGALFLLLNRDGTRLGGNLADWPEEIEMGDVRRAFSHNGEAFRGTGVELRGGFGLLAARSLSARNALLRQQSTAAGIATLIAFAASIGIGALLARGIERKLAGLNAVADAVTRGNLEARLSTGNMRDEFDVLAGNIGDMLDSVKGNQDRLRTLADHIAHELRTPLNRMRQRLAQIDTRLPAPDPEIDALAEEIDATARLLDTLLEIATTQSAELDFLSLPPLSLTALTQEMVALYQPVFEERGLRLNLNLNAQKQVSGVAPLLQQMVANILENAIKYAPEGSEVTLSLQDQARHVALSVHNETGAATPLADDALFEQFRRGDTVQEQEGAGLGLALVRAIALKHGGTATLGQERAGFDIKVRIPHQEI